MKKMCSSISDSCLQFCCTFLRIFPTNIFDSFRTNSQGPVLYHVQIQGRSRSSLSSVDATFFWNGSSGCNDAKFHAWGTYTFTATGWATVSKLGCWKASWSVTRCQSVKVSSLLLLSRSQRERGSLPKFEGPDFGQWNTFRVAPCIVGSSPREIHMFLCSTVHPWALLREIERAQGWWWKNMHGLLN